MIRNILQKIFLYSFLLGTLYSQTTQSPSARAKALGNAYYVFSDDGVGLLYCPAMLGKSLSSELTFTHIPLFINNSQESITGVKKFRRGVLAGILNITGQFLPSIQYNDIDRLYQDGFEKDFAGIDLELNSVIGYSYKLMENIYVGASLDYKLLSLYNNYYYTTYLRTGGYYIFDFPFIKDNLFASSLTLEKAGPGTIQNSSATLEKGGNMALGLKYGLKKIKTDFGLTLLFSLPKFTREQPTNIQVINGYGDSEIYMGFGIEALRNWYLSPKFSIGVPLKGDYPRINGGVTAGIDIKGYRYEVSYALSGEVGNTVDYNSLYHSMTFAVRQSLGAYTHMPITKMYLPENMLLFNALKENFPASKRVKTELLKNGITLNYAYNNAPISDKNIALLTKNSLLLLEEFLSDNISFQRKASPDLLIKPRILIIGKILRLEMSVYNQNGAKVYTAIFDGDYHKANEEFYQVDTIHLKKNDGKLRLLSQRKASFMRENQKSLRTVFNKWQEDFLNFIAKNYIKKITLTANMPNTLIKINGQPAIYYEGIPIELYLKPGKYIFQAIAQGLKTITITKIINQNISIPFRFEEDKFNVDLNLVLLGKKRNLTAFIGKSKSKFNDKLYTANIPNSQKKIIIKGLGKDLKIPLSFKERKIYTLYIMNDFTSDFKNNDAELWQPVVFSPNFNVDFTGRGLVLKGDSSGGKWRGNGITTKPFFINNMTLSYEVQKKKSGDLAFIITTEDNRQLSIIYKDRTISVLSDFGDKIVTEEKRGIVKALRVYDKNFEITVEKTGNKIVIYKNDTLLFEDKFFCDKPIQFIIAADSKKFNENIEYIIKRFSYRLH